MASIRGCRNAKRNYFDARIVSLEKFEHKFGVLRLRGVALDVAAVPNRGFTSQNQLVAIVSVIDFDPVCGGFASLFEGLSQTSGRNAILQTDRTSKQNGILWNAFIFRLSIYDDAEIVIERHQASIMSHHFAHLDP